jgi:ADP-ribose pyrophosphatase YjhB (NUDIX family)
MKYIKNFSSDDKTLMDLTPEEINKPIKKYVRAVIYNPKTDKFLFSYYGNIQGDNKYGLVGGSIDQGEGEIQALKREIQEETGFENFIIAIKLGSNTLSPRDPEFDKTDLIKENTAYLVIIDENQTQNSDEKTKYTQNEIKNGFKTLWMDSENVKFIGFYRHYQIFLDRAVSFLKSLDINPETKFWELNFWNRIPNSPLDNILKGLKTIETRALNPEEPTKYFGNIKTGDILVLKDQTTEDRFLCLIKQANTFKNLDKAFDLGLDFGDVFGAGKDSEETTPNHNPKYTLGYIKKWYADNIGKDYLTKIQRYGLIALKIQLYSGHSNQL